MSQVRHHLPLELAQVEAVVAHGGDERQSAAQVALEDDARQIAAAGVADEAEAALHDVHGQLAAVVVDDLLQQVDGVAKAAGGAAGYQLQPLSRAGDLLLLADVGEPVDGRLSGMRRKSKRWQREPMVAGILCGSVVARTKMTCGGGSSSVFRRALKPRSVSMCTSSMM